MRNLLTTGLVLGALAVVASTSEAGLFHRRGGGCGAPCGSPCGTGYADGCGSPCGAGYGMGAGCGMTVSYVEQTVTAYRMEMKEREVKYTVNTLVPKEETVKQKYYVMEPETKDEKRKVTEYKCVTEMVTRQVPVCVRVPVCCVDPCTGCPRTTYQTVTQMQEVTCPVTKMVPEEKEVTYKVTTYKQAEKERDVKMVKYEPKAEERTRKEMYCERVPYQTTVKVPVYTPAPAAPCPTPCPTPCGGTMTAGGCGSPCASPCGATMTAACGGCGDPCGHHGRRHHLLGRHRGGCCN